MAMLVFEIPVIALFSSNVTKVSLFRIFYGNFPKTSKNLNDKVCNQCSAAGLSGIHVWFPVASDVF
jgi:hypothetical protein